mgnify:FL=1
MSKEKKENAIKYIEGYKKAQPDKKYRKNPDTYLRNESWNDEIINSSYQKEEKVYDNMTKDDYDKMFKG